MGGAQALFNVGANATIIFSQDGQLQKIHFDKKGGKVPPWISAVKYYRHRKLLIDGRKPINADSDTAKRTVPLFTFSQTLHVLAVHVLTHRSFNLLPLTPEDYQLNRERSIEHLESFLRAEGLPSLKFCKNSGCKRIFPVKGFREWEGDTQKRRRTVYCSQTCEDTAKNKISYQQREDTQEILYLIETWS